MCYLHTIRDKIISCIDTRYVITIQSFTFTLLLDGLFFLHLLIIFQVMIYKIDNVNMQQEGVKTHLNVNRDNNK